MPTECGYASVTGLDPASDFHGLHIHETGKCEGNFMASAGGHWNPAGATHGDHNGDLPVLSAGADGAARTSFTTDAFTVSQLLSDPGGVAVIVHAGRDNYANIDATRYFTSSGPGADATTKSTGDAGSRYACGALASGPVAMGGGSWMAGSDGGVFNQGSATFHGSQAGKLKSPAVAIEASPGRAGYYLAAADGGVFAHGDAGFEGSAVGSKLNQPVVGMAVPPAHAKAILRNQAGATAFGDAPFLDGMAGTKLNQPIVSIEPTPTGQGYLLIARDGGVFAFGDATFEGGMGAQKLNQPVVGGAASESGHGYWLFAGDGGVFAFGDAEFLGSQAAKPLNGPVVGGAAHAG